MATNGKGVKRKRRPKDVCPNPLFVKWLEEWRDEAIENGWKTSYTYKKVLYSLKRYPLPINSGQEAKVLEYVGDKVAKKLDEKIRDYLANGGKMADLHSNADEQLPPAKRRQSNSSRPSTNNTHSDTTGSHTHTKETRTGSNKRKQCNINDPSDSPLCSSAKRSKSSKEYVPKYRSGPYALLIALIESEQDEEYGKGFMYKNELIDAAQEHCDSSFTVPDEPNSYYTAWSSMANLIKKELVVRSGHPPKFSLTDAGSSLSLRLLEKSKSGIAGFSSSQADSQSCIDNTRASQVTTCSQSTSRSLSLSLSPVKPTTPSKRKTISIMDSDDDDDDDIVEILPLAQRLGLHKTQPPKSSKAQPPKSSKAQPPKSSQTQPPKSSKAQPPKSSQTQPPKSSKAQPPKSSQTQPPKSSQTQPPKSSQTQPPKSSQARPPKSSQTQQLKSSQTQPSTMSQVQIEDPEPQCSQQSLTVIPTLTPSTSSAMSEEVTSVDFSSPLFTLRPGQFEVLLCIDNSESSANRKSKANFRGLLLEELTKNGVKFSVRNLNIGDFLWIAKEIVNADPDQLRLPESREIVLDYIIERKRMDDLSDSIIDRRFHEQKFRMKLCGVANSVYLVEDYGDIAHCKVSQRGLYQAITNTQVIDNFFIKQTKDIKGSISYLTIMTRQLQKKYIDETIKAFPVETLQHFHKEAHPSKPPFICGMPFNKFNEASIKNKVSTVSEMFARQLIQVPNSSADKAHAIIQQYPTMADLYEGYSKCSDEKERENLLSSVRFGTSKRKIGAVLSKILYSLYWKGE